MLVELPQPLREIAEEARRFKEQLRPPTELESEWQAYLRRAKERVPNLVVKEEQATVCLGELSPGCQACKEGSWDCLFITKRCNLNCSFCYNPHNLGEDLTGSAFGESPEEIASHYAHTRITGISFSGGEPFLEPEKLTEWASFFRQHFPDSYLWIYTNGLRIHDNDLKQLGGLPVDEIRFNAAATGYDDRRVMTTIRKAAGYFKHLTVEIPAIPAQAEKVYGSLEKWAQAGVRYLNLHELLYEPGSNSWAMQGERQPICLADGHSSAMHPRSREMILQILQRVQAMGLPLNVNHCSLPNKLHQIHGRRLSLLPLTQANDERLIEGDRLESFRLFDEQGQVVRVHPDELAGEWRRYPGYRCARLVRTAPLGLHDPGQWVVFDLVSPYG
jgi:pyruvate formate-lyase activating enzyme-like uncharacterized protein